MSLSAKDAPEQIFIDMERMHDFTDASRAIVSVEHAENPTEHDVRYIRADAALMDEVRGVLEGLLNDKSTTYSVRAMRARALLTKIGGGE
jgi:hypothetical protein